LSGRAQQMLAGRIHKKNSQDVLLAVTVENLALYKFDQSDMGGNYRIQASPGDRVVFSITGYRPDTVTVDEGILSDRYEVYLVPNVVQLATVDVGGLNAYQVDSLQRIQDYEAFYHDRTPTSLLGRSTPASGVGITFSPISFFSKKVKDKKKLKKRLAGDEEEFYISYRFSRNYISRLTKLNEDSLTLFIERYRPTYKFCRSASEEDMLNYVNDHFKQFMKRR
jgi:hypothetical protein